MEAHTNGMCVMTRRQSGIRDVLLNESQLGLILLLLSPFATHKVLMA